MHVKYHVLFAISFIISPLGCVYWSWVTEVYNHIREHEGPPSMNALKLTSLDR